MPDFLWGKKKYYEGIILTKCNKDQVKFQVKSWKR